MDALNPAQRKLLGITKQSAVGDRAFQTSTKLSGHFSKAKNRTGEPTIEELRKAANDLNKTLKPLRETPQNGNERRWLRERLEQVQSRLKAEGIEIENADLQALLWYNEKELYELLGYRSPKGSSDYAGAAEATPPANNWTTV